MLKVLDDERLEIANQEEIQFDKFNEKYEVVPKLDQREVFDKGWSILGEGKCMGIFPEGGSHDRTDLLPLKAGACILCLGANIHHNVDCKIVTCGLNYDHVYNLY